MDKLNLRMGRQQMIDLASALDIARGQTEQSAQRDRWTELAQWLRYRVARRWPASAAAAAVRPRGDDR